MTPALAYALALALSVPATTGNGDSALPAPAMTDIPVERLSDPEQRYVTLLEFVSPLTQDHFNAKVLASRPRVTSSDFDGCPHAEINLLEYTLVIDPATGWVAYPEEFSRLPQFTQAELKTILGAPRFNRDTPEGQPWAGAQAWERFENAAKIAEAADAPASAVASWWLQAAWSVRLDLIPAELDFGDDLAATVSRMPAFHSSSSELFVPYQLQLADFWTIQAPIEDPQAALAIAWVYRSRGELVAARDWLDKARSADSGIAGQPLYAYLDSSIQLEREYLGKARQWLEKAWQASEIAAPRQGAAAFTLGEVARRLNDVSGARLWYDEAAIRSLGAVSPAVLERQRAIVAADKAY